MLLDRVPASLAWTLEESHRTAIEEGLVWAAATPAVETDLDEFLADIETERQNRQLGQPNPEKR
jgi:hypothetical protein